MATLTESGMERLRLLIEAMNGDPLPIEKFSSSLIVIFKQHSACHGFGAIEAEDEEFNELLVIKSNNQRTQCLLWNTF